LHHKILADLLSGLVAVLERNEGVDSLASKFVGNTDDSRFGNLVVFKESGLDLSSRQTVSRDVDHVVDTTANPVVSVVVTASAISSEVVTLIDVEVSLLIPVVGSPDSTSHARPGLLEGQNTLDIVTVNLFARNRVDEGRLDTEERQRATARLGGSDSSQGG
jgi:hypothetical protein